MKVLAFNGSPRKGGNTEYLLREVFKPLEAAGIETELIQLGAKPLQGCTGCRTCAERQNQRCIFEDDPVNDWVQALIQADGVLLGSPTYYADITSNMKAFMDRVGYVVRQNGDLLRRKVGAGVLAVRRAGSIHGFDTMNHFFLVSQMMVPGSIYWNLGIGKEKGEVAQDAEGMETMRILGENIAWLLHKLHE